MDHLQIRVSTLPFDQPQIQLKVGHLAHDGLGIRHLQLDPRAGLLAHITGHNLDRQIVADTECRADPQVTKLLVPGQRTLQTARLLKQCLSPRPDAFAQLVQLQSLAYPIKQLHIKLAFQILQCTAGRRLRHRQAGRCTREVFMEGRGEEYLKLAKGVFHNRFSRIVIYELSA